MAMFRSDVIVCGYFPGVGATEVEIKYYRLGEDVPQISLTPPRVLADDKVDALVMHPDKRVSLVRIAPHPDWDNMVALTQADRYRYITNCLLVESKGQVVNAFSTSKSERILMRGRSQRCKVRGRIGREFVLMKVFEQDERRVRAGLPDSNVRSGDEIILTSHNCTLVEDKRGLPGVRVMSYMLVD